MNIGIIGFGVMGKTRLKTINSMGGGHRVTMISDPKKIDSTGMDLAGIKLTGDYNDIITNKDIGAVFVCTPNYLTKEIVVKALKHNKHVFSEKPPGRNLAEINEMIAEENSNPGIKLMFGFNHRHHDSMIYAKKLIDSKKYGEILWIRGRYGKSVNADFTHTWRAKKEFAGGGIFLDQGIHMLDLFLMMAGEFDEVKAFVSNLYWHLDIEDNVFAIFKNKKGQVAQLHSTMTQWRHLFSLEIFMEKGYITINGLKTTSNAYGDEIMTIAQNRTQPPAAQWTNEEHLTFHTDRSWERELTVFINAIREKQEVSVGNTKDAIKLMQ